MVLIWTSCPWFSPLLCLTASESPGNLKGRKGRGERRNKQHTHISHIYTQALPSEIQIPMYEDCQTTGIIFKALKWLHCEADVDKWWTKQPERKGSGALSFMNIVLRGKSLWGLQSGILPLLATPKHQSNYWGLLVSLLYLKIFGFC